MEWIFGSREFLKQRRVLPGGAILKMQKPVVKKQGIARMCESGHIGTESVHFFKTCLYPIICASII
jgi:hypothetical protein